MQEQPGRKRKHSPIVWEPGAPKHSRTAAEGAANAATAGGSGGGGEDRRAGEARGSRGRGDRAERVEAGGSSLYERTAHEAEEFRRQQMEEEGFDPEAPPALKPSPSGSEGELQGGMRASARTCVQTREDVGSCVLVLFLEHCSKFVHGFVGHSSYLCHLDPVLSVLEGAKGNSQAMREIRVCVSHLMLTAYVGASQ
eukprot:scaffold112341_cov24-Tisochrysis_lutea.AAC.2